jgi:hypothetical protein
MAAIAAAPVITVTAWILIRISGRPSAFRASETRLISAAPTTNGASAIAASPASRQTSPKATTASEIPIGIRISPSGIVSAVNQRSEVRKAPAKRSRS